MRRGTEGSLVKETMVDSYLDKLKDIHVEHIPWRNPSWNIQPFVLTTQKNMLTNGPYH